MGNVCSISIPLDDLVSGSWNCITAPANNVCKLQKNFDALKIATKNLIAQKDDVKRRIRLAEEQQMAALEQVNTWILSVEDAQVDINKVIEDGAQEIEKLCIGGCCSKNCKSSYKFGKEVAQKLEYVATLKSNGVFEMVADRALLALGDLKPSEPTVGMESVLDMAWSYLGQEDVGIIGLFGVEGVGKTALLTQINNRFLIPPPSHFDVVIWVVVSKDLGDSPNLGKVQDDIWKRIGFLNDTWKQKNQDEKASEIFKVLSEKKFVLLLDDIWKEVDLVKVGIPLPKNTNKAKLIFTTRFKEICGHMQAHKMIEVKCLPWEKSWELFQEKVGDEAIGRHPNINRLAETVARECGGLPLTLINIGRAMATKFTTEEWECAINLVKVSASTFPDLRFSAMDFSVMVGTFGGRVGAIGGQGGAKWDDGSYDGIRQIIIFCGLVIDSIQVEYANGGGSWCGVKHGGNGGHKTAKVELDFPDEYLTLVLGYYSSKFRKRNVIHSLIFKSNKRTFGPFGGNHQDCNKFIIPASNGKIVGFFGRSDDYLDAIGAHVQPICNPNFLESIGPFGGEGERQWDDGNYTTIREILIWSSSVIDSIRIHYDKDGNSEWSPIHGESSGRQLQTVTFDYPNEFLILIDGSYGPYLGKTIVHSLTFQTNKNRYGPFGTEKENKFSIPSNGGKIVGFFGSSSTLSFINSIGAYVQTISHP